ncbi:probable amidase [Pseudozyma hubeiensis SY62]|uniref:amidase n=1 Tax=Pseudozyma hubeiensis (strain SY62) TaxID=1305764 RepID=R9NYM6_PSEHS|nr:probable amidase [Pseudozyma hubeiensis SY62]GAC93893.1 probable amidase [Pseudozyma hubeiensis SY62]
MSSTTNYESCQTWQEIAAEHRKSLQFPAGTISDDPQLSEWSQKANLDYTNPSNTRPGPSLSTLLQNDSTRRIWSSELDAVLDGLDATGIVELTRSGKAKVQDVVQHFLSRASIVHQATNCLSHFFAEDAIRRAKDLDDKRATLEAEGRLDELGQLFGLPMSIKGHMSYGRHGSQRGFVFDVLPDPSSHPLVRRNLATKQVELLASTQGRYVSENPVDSSIAKLLLENDAVIIGKTTMPQGVMHLDTTNNLYGQTLNPHNLALSPGGSSGGESALVAGGGSAMGVGSDIGGSIRQPCGVTGLYGIRPTTQRLPYGGVRSTMPGNEGVGSSLGPMAKSMRDVELFMSSLMNDRTRPWEWDHTVLPMPWRKVDGLLHGGRNESKPIVVGVMMEDGVARPTTPVRRALSKWVDKLSAFAAQSGTDLPRIELRRWNPRDLHRRAWDIIRSLYFMDSGKMFALLSKATGEPLLPLTQFILSEPYVRSATADLDADAASSADARKLDEMSYTESCANIRAREAFRKEFLQAWNERGLDCLLCPVMCSTAPRPGTIKYWGYTSVFNLVDYPGVVFPSGFKADAEVDGEFEDAEADGGQFGYARRDGWMSDFDKDNTEEYEQHRQVFDGAPVGLQLIGRRYKDEELVKYAELLQHIAGST